MGDLDGEQGERLGMEELAALDAPEFDRDRLGLHEAPQLAQVRSMAIGVECDREMLAQAVAHPVIAQQPQDDAVLLVAVQVQEPARSFNQMFHCRQCRCHLCRCRWHQHLRA